MSKLGGNIKRFRIGKGWSQKELAEMMGKTESAVSNWERGKNKMDTDDIEKACVLLGVTPEVLLGWETPDDVRKAAEATAAAIMADPLFAELEAIVSGMSEKERAQLLRMARAMKEDE